MTDFDSALQERLQRNAQLAEQRADAEREMDRVVEQRRADDERHRVELQQARGERHAELADRLRKVAEGLKAAAPDAFVVRLGWTQSGEEFIAKVTSRQMSPARTLFIELDRDDDEVIARWTSSVGNSVEIWRLLEVEAPLLEALVLQAADQELWRHADRPPAFPEL